MLNNCCIYLDRNGSTTATEEEILVRVDPKWYSNHSVNGGPVPFLLSWLLAIVILLQQIKINQFRISGWSIKYWEDIPFL